MGFGFLFSFFIFFLESMVRIGRIDRQNCVGRFWYHLVPMAEAKVLVPMPVLANHSKTTVSTASHLTVHVFPSRDTGHF